MSLKRMVSISVIGLILMVLIFPGADSSSAWDKETWLKLPPYEWKGKKPELAEEWAKMIGFKAPDVVGKLAPEIKPGMIIDDKNYKNFSGLKQLLSGSLYARLDANSYAPLSPIKVVKTTQYYYTEGLIKKSLENLISCKIGGDGITMEGYCGGIAFPRPKSGIELIWCMDNKYLGDTMYMNPQWLRLFGRDNRPERDMKWYLGQVRWAFRCDWGDDIKPNPEGINYASSGWFFYPRDISGTCYLRRRFLGVEKPDEFMLYLPSMRRVRRMSGRDAQDPVFGSDLTWDDFQGFYQKISAVSFPAKWKIAEITERLIPTEIHIDYPKGEERPPDSYVDESGDQMFLFCGSWQRRPVYILEGEEQDENYMYGKRVIFIDRETFWICHNELYDQRGRLWRTHLRNGIIVNTTGEFNENFYDMVDHLNEHRTIGDMKGIPNPRWVGPEYSEMKFIIRKGK